MGEVINIRSTSSRIVLDSLIAHFIVFRHAQRREDYSIYMDSRTAVYGDGGCYIERYTQDGVKDFANFFYGSLEGMGFSLNEYRITRGNFSMSFPIKSVRQWKDLLIEIIGSETIETPHTIFLPEKLPFDQTTYREYIKSTEWKTKSDEAKERAGHRCQLCNAPDSDVSLNTHHRTYERLGNELHSDLIVLCRDCHAKFHNKIY